MRKNDYYLFFLLCSMTFLLSACGFHLQRGRELALPLHRLQLQAQDPYGALSRYLKQYLHFSHVKIVDNAAQADTILSILADVSSQTLISVSGTQQTRQYNLVVAVTFTLTDTKGHILLPAETLSESRVVTIQSSQILGSSNEVNLFSQQMHRAIANAIINRLAAKEVVQIINKRFAANENIPKQ